MITANLYPTSTTYPQGGNSELTAELTNSWYSTVDSITIDSLESYWLGYIKKDNLPQDFKQGVLYVDNGKLVIKDCTDAANFPCGYVYHNNYSGANLQQNLYINIDGVETWTASTATRLINQLYPEYAGVGYTQSNSYYFGKVLDIRVIGALYDMGGNLLNITSPYYVLSESGSISFIGARNSVKQAFDFLFNNATARLHWRHVNDDYYFECTASDFANGSAFLTDTTEHVQLRAFIVSYELQSNVRLYSSNSQNFLTTFAAKVSASYNNSHREYIRSYIGQYDEYEWWEYSNSSFSIKNKTAENPYYAIGWANDEIDVSEIERIDHYSVDSGVPYGYTEKTFMCRHNQSGYAPHCCFHHIVPIDSIQKHFSLAFRVDVSGILTPSYVANFTYATDVTSNNEFLAKLKTGNLSDATFKNGLREWQYTDFQADEFDEDDIPPYTPEPEPGGDDDPGSDEPVDTPLITGDDQEIQTDRTLGTCTNFVTMYVITPPMMSIFGRTLWTSIADYDPQDPTTAEIFKNFFAILSEDVTGTLDIGAILNFVVSVRQYPFNVAGLSIVTPSGDSIKIGTGKLPISLGTGANVQRLTSTIGLLDCGTLTIGNYKDFKLYNDFRDYLNTSVSAFLPYCGTVELNPIEVIHNTLHCYYAIDFYTGECTAYITCTDGSHNWISAIKNGNIGVLIPVTATNSGQVSARHISDNAKDSSLITSAVGNMAGAVGNFASGNVMGGISSILGLAQIGAAQKQLDAERQGRSAVMAPSLSGGSGAAAFFQPSCASILVRRGTYARDKIQNYPQTCAYPSTTSGTLNSFHGYTECYNVDVTGLNCTEEERAAVKTILETGCYL